MALKRCGLLMIVKACASQDFYGEALLCARWLLEAALPQAGLLAIAWMSIRCSQIASCKLGGADMTASATAEVESACANSVGWALAGRLRWMLSKILCVKVSY